jgi:hypothetical protein
MGTIESPTFLKTPTLSPDNLGIGEISIPLFGLGQDERFWSSGTAVVIAPWLAITARHVVEDYLERFGGDECMPINPKFRLFTLLALAGGKETISLAIGRMWFHPALDIAILELVPTNDQFPKDHAWKLPALDLSPPRVGTRIAVLGYPNSPIDPPMQNSASPSTWFMSPTTATGVVEEVHLDHRDKYLLPFPCFRTNARFDGGMSGAPICNEAGLVCGIVCSGMELTEQSGYVSYASLLWPAMGIRINKSWDRYPEGTYYFVHELAAAKYITTVGLDTIHIEHSPAGLTKLMRREPVK